MFLLYFLLMILYAQTLPPFSNFINKIEALLSLSEIRIFVIDIIILAIIITFLLRGGFLFRGVLNKRNLEPLTFIYLLLGFLAIAVGWIKGNSNLFFDFRFYFYSLLAVSLPIFLDSTKKLYNFIKVFVVINFLAIFYSVVNIYIPRNFSFGYLVNFRFLNLSVVLILITFLFYKNKSLKLKALLAVGLPILIFVLFIDSARSVYLGLLIGLLILLKNNVLHFLKKKRTLMAFTLLFVIISAAGIISGILPQAYQRLKTSSSFDQDVSVRWRINAIEVAWDKFWEDPILGTGTGYQFEFFNPETKEFGKNTLHNFHFSLLTIGGVFSYIFFLYFLFKILRKAKLVYKNTPGNLLSYIALAGYVSLLSYGIILFFTVFTISNFVVLWLLAGLCLTSYNVYLNEKSISNIPFRLG